MDVYELIDFMRKGLRAYNHQGKWALLKDQRGMQKAKRISLDQCKKMVEGAIRASTVLGGKNLGLPSEHEVEQKAKRLYASYPEFVPAPVC